MIKERTTDYINKSVVDTPMYEWCNLNRTSCTKDKSSLVYAYNGGLIYEV